jgi:putative nucleotidyltransferase with HDIG domain
MPYSNGKQTLRILLIEDSPDDEELIKIHLSRNEYKPIILRVESESALRVAISESTWDLVLCDYLLPTFSAHKALQIVREDLDDIPFIVLSGFENEEQALEILKAGAHDFVYKSQIGRLPLVVRRELRHAGERMSSRIELEKSYLATVEAWGQALELRDVHTKNHTLRVTDLTLRLARALGVSSSQFNSIRYGALLHDIGKMGIPDSVLLKRDTLEPSELSIIKLHPIIAYEMIKGIPFLREASSIPYCHHEKYDGSGYPRGLAGEDIPIEARIFSICDVFDALTNDRPYRSPWERDKALEYIQAESGKSFDPAIARKFIEVMK